MADWTVEKPKPVEIMHEVLWAVEIFSPDGESHTLYTKTSVLDIPSSLTISTELPMYGPYKHSLNLCDGKMENYKIRINHGEQCRNCRYR